MCYNYLANDQLQLVTSSQQYAFFGPFPVNEGRLNVKGPSKHGPSGSQRPAQVSVMTGNTVQQKGDFWLSLSQLMALLTLTTWLTELADCLTAATVTHGICLPGIFVKHLDSGFPVIKPPSVHLGVCARSLSNSEPAPEPSTASVSCYFSNK